jgi:predicted esterase
MWVSALTGATVVACAPTVVAADCRAGALGFINGTKQRTVGTLDVFRLDNYVRPGQGTEILLVSRDAAGAVESQKVRFAAKGAGTGGTGTPDLSQGTGGQKGRFEAQYQMPGGGSSRFMANVPQDNGPQKAHGLLVLLHGSSASSYDTFVDDMAQVAQQNNLIPVSVLAPNGQAWNEGDMNADAAFLDSLVQQKLYKEYNIDKTKVFFSGQSSGGGFLASHFVALHGNNYRGGAFMQCGLQPPQSAFTASDVMKRSFKLHFEITSDDPIWLDYFEPTITQYKSAGLVVTSDNTKTGGHCAFDQAAVIAAHIGSMLTQ